MTQPRKPRLPSNLVNVLVASGKTWRIDNGARHYKIIIDDRFAGILPKGSSLSGFHGRADKNTVAQVRRFLRGQL